MWCGLPYIMAALGGSVLAPGGLGLQMPRSQWPKENFITFYGLGLEVKQYHFCDSLLGNKGVTWPRLKNMGHRFYLLVFLSL